MSDGKILKAEKFYYNYLIPFYRTKGSLLSIDFCNELTDISAMAMHGISSEKQVWILCYSRKVKKGINLLEQMEKEKVFSRKN